MASSNYMSSFLAFQTVFLLSVAGYNIMGIWLCDSRDNETAINVVESSDAHEFVACFVFRCFLCVDFCLEFVQVV